MIDVRYCVRASKMPYCPNLPPSNSPSSTTPSALVSDSTGAASCRLSSVAGAP
jgi:hypothetical protein